MFKKFYEKGKEIDYEIEKPIKTEEIWTPLDSIFSSLDNVDVVDVYYKEVEVEKDKIYPTIIVDVYKKDGSNIVYLIYVEDLDEYEWTEIKEKIAEKYKGEKLNVCDEDQGYVSFCT